jgi:8-oxo-dGTP pyrophosphatase MutT (NUDIX family)
VSSILYESRTIRVVSGVLVSPRGDGILMCLRRRTALRPLLWELAGGKIDPADAGPREALAREWREELFFRGPDGGESPVAVRAGERIATGIVDADVQVLIELFHVIPEGGRHRPSLDFIGSRDHEEVRWVDPYDAVRHLPCSPGFYVHYPFLRLWWGEHLCSPRWNEP